MELPVWRLVLDPLAAFTSTTIYIETSSYLNLIIVMNSYVILLKWTLYNWVDNK